MVEHEELVRATEQAMRNIFGENKDSGRFIDTTKIPFICKDIEAIKNSLSDINDKIDTKLVTQDQFWPVKALVYGATGLILVGVVAALLAMVVQ